MYKRQTEGVALAFVSAADALSPFLAVEDMHLPIRANTPHKSIRTTNVMPMPMSIVIADPAILSPKDRESNRLCLLYTSRCV